ncbi:MAG TPA: alpha/beta fold hydrolase [Anaerolineales bacterium]|nr:alpha/beta fold hydrolase [Anaerolineales bacterium]
MKKFRWLVFVLVFLSVVIGPVLVAQSKGQARRVYDDIPLGSLQYEEVFFHNEEQGLNLAGMLFVPEGVGPFPAVAIIHGSGTSERDNNWYLALASYLQENGVAVLLPDKRGSEKSEGNWRTSSYEDLATDSVAAVDFLKSQQMVEISKIGIIGMSQGGQISPYVVHLSPEIDFLIDVVGTSLNNYDVLHYEESNNLQKMGFFPVVADLIAYPSTWVLRNFTQKEFWGAVGNFDALPYWEELSIPTLVMYGGDDPNVPAEASKARLESLNKDNITVNIYEGSEHALQDPPGMGTSRFRIEALTDIKNFIDSVVSGE